jgi:hypothetical protein
MNWNYNKALNQSNTIFYMPSRFRRLSRWNMGRTAHTGDARRNAYIYIYIYIYMSSSKVSVVSVRLYPKLSHVTVMIISL